MVVSKVYTILTYRRAPEKSDLVMLWGCVFKRIDKTDIKHRWCLATVYTSPMFATVAACRVGVVSVEIILMVAVRLRLWTAPAICRIVKAAITHVVDPAWYISARAWSRGGDTAGGKSRA
jgi:hypothetical protein